MKNNKIIMLAFVLVGLCCSLFLNLQRYNLEKANRQVETVMDYGDLVRLAQVEGEDTKKILQQFKDKGVTTLVVYDTTLEKLEETGALQVITGRELLAAQALGTLKPQWQEVVKGAGFAAHDLYITKGTSAVVFGEALEDLRLRLGKDKVRLLGANKDIIALQGDLHQNSTRQGQDEQEGILKLNLGISSEELKQVANSGFRVAVRPTNYVEPYRQGAAPAAQQIDAFFSRLDKAGMPISLIFGTGKTMLGQKDNLPQVAQALRQRKIILGMPEGVNQLQFVPLTGMMDLAKEMDYQVARAYIIDGLEQKELSFFEAFRRWSISDEERNIRVNYIKIFTTPRDSKTLLDTNLSYVERINQSVAARGFTSGAAGIYEVYRPNFLLFFPIVLAIMTGAFRYGGEISSWLRKKQIPFILLSGVVAEALLFLPQFSLLVRQALALMAAVFFPVLSIIYMVKGWEKKSGEACGSVTLALRTSGQLMTAVVLSLVGASFLAAILGDIRFFLELDIYRGVKLTFILPVLLSFLWYAKQHPLWSKDKVDKPLLARVALILEQPFTLKLLFALGVFGFIAWVFVGRSGHSDGVPVPAFEIKMRVFLEQVMYARPREKEFLIGHPAFFLAALACAKRLPKMLICCLVMGATIGQGSLVQTFAHMRTPIIMSYIRALDGLALGLVLGLVVFFAFNLILPYLTKMGRRLGFYE